MQMEDKNNMPDMLGKTIGQYQLIELIGKGDTSFVYKAFQPAMSRYVAVKVLFPALATSPEFMEQFQRRLARIASLQHNHILPVYDYGQEDGMLYLVTRYVEDGTLEDHLPDYYSPRAALRIIQPIADALDYAHARGLVHAKLDPANILIDEERRPLLADFGALQQEPVVPRLPNPYTSPEQFQGVPVDQRSDVYGLGALLYALLVGQSPLPDRVPTPRAYRPDLPPAVEKVILKAMAPAPQQRFQSAGELRRAFQQALQPQPAPAPQRQPAVAAPEPEPVVYTPAPEQKQDYRGLRGLIYVFGTLALLAIVAAIYFIFFARGDDEAVAPTAAPGVPMVTAITDVNVRAGPDTAYEVVGVMREGQNAEAIGVSPDSAWWVVNFPAVAGGRGWVSSRFTNASDTGNLPIIQPPARPTEEPLPTDPPPAPTEPPLPTDEPPTVATDPLPPTPTSDEIVEVPTLPPEGGSTEEPPAGGGPGIGICTAPATLLLFGLVLVLPLSRRRH